MRFANTPLQSRAAGELFARSSPTMKTLLLFALLLSFTLPAAAKGTGAKEALRTLSRLRGATWLDRVVQMTGTRGQDQPASWHIIASDGKGGLQQFVVNARSIVSEGPVPANAVAALRGPAVAQKKFVTNSTHAFVAAEGVAKKVGLGFDSANFRLRCAPRSTTPSWQLELLDANGHKLSEVTVSAVSGKVLHAITYPQPVPVNQPPAQSHPMDRTREVVNNGVKGVGRGLQRAGSWISGIFNPPLPAYPPPPR